MADGDLTDLVSEVLRRAPEWVRVDLTSRKLTTRARAEDTLAGMIAAALTPERSHDDVGVDSAARS